LFVVTENIEVVIDANSDSEEGEDAS